MPFMCLFQMGCSSSKAVKVVPEKEDQQVPILAPLSEPIHTFPLEKLDNSQGTLNEENEMPKQKGNGITIHSVRCL
jgi:hypothetical protein